MGACATKPKVLKDGDEKPVSPLPEPLPPHKEAEEAEVKVAQREAENDAPLAPIESPAKNPSLGNLFIKESENAEVSPGNESENENAANSSQEKEATKAPEVGNTEALGILPAPSATMADVPVEKEAIKAPEIIAKEDTEALPEPATMADVPVEKEAIKAPEIIAKENTVALDKFPEPIATINDASIEKMDSQASEIVLEDYADALPAPASPVVADAPTEKLAVSAPEPEIVNKENTKETVLGEESVADSLEKIPTPQPPPATEFSEEYTDALADSDAPTEKVAVGTDEAASQSIINEQTEEEKLKQTEDAKLIPPLNIADKKTDEENAVAVEKQIEVAESVNPTTQS